MSKRARIALAVLGVVVASCQPQGGSEQPGEGEGEALHGAAGDSADPVAAAGEALILGSNTYTPIADTVLRSGAPFANDGMGQTLGVTAASVADVKRSIIRFNENSIKTSIPAGRVLQSARLDVIVNGISAGWLGGAIDIHAMNREWVEGTGLLGNGASWVCANDTNTTLLGNLTNNCTAANNWSMTTPAAFPRPFNTQATDRVRVFTGGLTKISFDVTADVLAVIKGGKHYGWMLAGAPSLAGGLWVNFGSRETLTAKPQLVINYGSDDCPSDPNKGLVGACGCGKADLDTNLDDVPDCFDGAVVATGDTALRLAAPFQNDGTGIFLPTTAASIVDIERSLIRFDNAAIDAARKGATIQKAYLEMTVAGIAVGWAGGQIAVHRMNAAPQWVEGTGLAGYGATWSCANDVNTTIFGLLNDCPPGDDWFMSPLQWSLFPRPFNATPTAVVGVTWPGMTSVRFDVTADVNAFLANPSSNNGWIVQGQASNFLSGNWVNFGSRESGAPPRLLLELPDTCATTFKSSPGVCGCSIPDTDRDSDGTPDCVDECPDNNPQILKTACGCGDDLDRDNDGLEDCIDPCPDDGDPTLGGGCGCPSDPAPAGTECRGACVSPNDPSGVDACDGAGHCGDVGNPSLCPPPDPSCPSCKPIVVQNVTAGSKYSVFWSCPCPRSGDLANGRCDAFPGFQLVKIDSAEKNAFVHGLIDSDTWIGANDRGMEGEWRWEWADGHDGDRFWKGGSSGSQVGAAYNNWQSSEPGGGSSENCGAMSFTSLAGDWQDRPCSQNLDFICERDLEVTGTGDGTSHTIPTDETCAFLGTRCGPYPIACTPDPNLSDTAIEQQYNEVSACDTCTRNTTNCPGGDNPTQAQIDQCTSACNAACSGASESPQPGDVPCVGMDDYTLTPTAFSDPPAEKHCAIQAPSSALIACPNQAFCDSVAPGTHCGELFHCADCDPTTGVCPECAGELDTTQDPPGPVAQCAPRLVDGKNQNLCEADKYCGVPVPECILTDTDTTFCSEINICANPEDVHTSEPPDDPDALEIPAVFDPTGFTVPPVNPPDPFFPEDRACAGTNCVPPATDQHPWCHYDVTEGLASQTPPSASKPVKTGKPSSLTFEVTPNLNLIYQTDLGPLGMPLPLLAAEASFKAEAFIKIFKLSKSFPLIDLAAGARGGIHRDSDPAREVCGFKAYARAEILGMDVLPEDVNFRMPDENSAGEDLQAKCLKAVDDFQKVVDSSRKAFADARELVRQYKDLKNQGKYFSDGTGAATTLCEQIAKSPPRNFPVWFPCDTERPVDTINRFIYFYNTVVIGQVRTAAAELGTKLDALIATRGLSGEFPIVKPVQEDEQITLFNTTFLIGPVPANLEVLLNTQYGVGANVLAEFRIGQLMGTLVAAGVLDDHPVFKVGLNGGPSAGVGLSLFAGVGFDIGFASAKLGIEGAVDIGHVELPVNAWAGVGVSTKPDARMPPASWAETVDVASGNLIPTQRLAFDLRWGYGADLRLNHVLGGSLALALKIKFFFFSKKWRKTIVSFSGLCPKDGSRQKWCDIQLFSAGGRSNLGWGEIQLPMPFYPIKYLDWTVTDPNGTETFNTTQVGKLFYDTLCQCIPHWNDASPPEQDCFRREDCCGHEADSNLTCYHNPTPVNGVFRNQCTGCRLVNQNCREDSDCCNNTTTTTCFKNNPNDPNEVGTCKSRVGICGDCTRAHDCWANQTPPLLCSGANHCVDGADTCGVIE